MRVPAAGFHFHMCGDDVPDAGKQQGNSMDGDFVYARSRFEGESKLMRAVELLDAAGFMPSFPA